MGITFDEEHLTTCWVFDISPKTEPQIYLQIERCSVSKQVFSYLQIKGCSVSKQVFSYLQIKGCSVSKQVFSLVTVM